MLFFGAYDLSVSFIPDISDGTPTHKVTGFITVNLVTSEC